jgi:hypothetical protein
MSRNSGHLATVKGNGSCDNATTVTHIDLLLQFMNDYFGSNVRRLKSLFHLLWALFKPNIMVYTTCPGSGKPRCVKFVSAEEKNSVYKGKYFNVDCHYLNHDGKRFGEATVTLEIPEFSGVQKIHALDVFPLQFHKEEETVRSELMRYGRNFVSLQGIHHQHYHGAAFYMRKGVPVKFHVKGRVIADATFFQGV